DVPTSPVDQLFADHYGVRQPVLEVGEGPQQGSSGSVVREEGPVVDVREAGRRPAHGRVVGLVGIVILRGGVSRLYGVLGIWTHRGDLRGGEHRGSRITAR